MAGAGKALVLGATGLIGSHLQTELAGRGLATVGTSTTGEGADAGLDLTDAGSVDALLDRLRPGLIFHVAGMSSLDQAWADPAAAFRLNTTGVLNLLEGLRRHAAGAHLVFASSAGVYGGLETEDGRPFTERSPVRPASPYGASKAAAELVCGQYGRQHGTGISVARIFNQVGPGQSVSQAPSELAREIALAEARGESRVAVPLGNPSATRDFIDVRDTARALAVLGSGQVAGTFNVCSGHGTSLEEIVRLLGAATRLEVTAAAKPGHHRPADASRIIGSPARLEAATGWKPVIPLAESLAVLLDEWRADRIRPHDE